MVFEFKFVASFINFVRFSGGKNNEGVKDGEYRDIKQRTETFV